MRRRRRRKRRIRRRTHCHISLKVLKQRIIDVDSFWLSKSALFKCTNNFGSVFLNRLDRKICDFKFPTQISLLFLNFCLPYDFDFSWTFRTFLSFVTVAIFSLYHSPVDCRSSNDRGIFRHKVNYRYSFHFPTLEFLLPPEITGVWSSRER